MLASDRFLRVVVSLGARCSSLTVRDEDSKNETIRVASAAVEASVAANVSAAVASAVVAESAVAATETALVAAATDVEANGAVASGEKRALLGGRALAPTNRAPQPSFPASP